MARVKGTAIFAVNFEPTGQSPLDARLLVPDLDSLYTGYTDNNYYPNMVVTVQDCGDGNPGQYMLIDPEQIGNASGWQRVDAASVKPVEIVNDLTTGGADKALSAEQGKVLDQKITESKNTINEYTVNTHKISENPVLDGADINLSEAYAEAGEYAAPAVSDSVDVAIGKLAKGVSEVKAENKVTSVNGEHGEITIATGDTQGSIKVNSTNIPVNGLKSAAYSDSSEFDPAGSADAVKTEVIGTNDDPSSSDTIKGVKKYIDEKVEAVPGTLIVNDLVTGGVDKALSAEQGKVLKTELDQHKADTNNPHSVTKDQVGLSNVTNDAQVKRSEMGVASGVATLDENGKIPTSQLNGQLARVFGIEKAVANFEALPPEATEGERYYTIDTKKIYEKTSDGWSDPQEPKEDTIYNFRKTDVTGSDSRTNILYRWDGADMTEISASLALGETQGTAYEGNKGKQNADNIASLQTKVGEIDNYTVNGKKISTNPVIGAADIQTASDGSVEDALGNIHTEFAEADATTLQSAKNYADQKISQIPAGVKFYSQVISSESVSPQTINAASHGCGKSPMVQCMLGTEVCVTGVTINASGDITISWNGTLSGNLTVKVIGM